MAGRSDLAFREEGQCWDLGEQAGGQHLMFRNERSMVCGSGDSRGLREIQGAVGGASVDPYTSGQHPEICQTWRAGASPTGVGRLMSCFASSSMVFNTGQGQEQAVSEHQASQGNLRCKQHQAETCVFCPRFQKSLLRQRMWCDRLYPVPQGLFLGRLSRSPGNGFHSPSFCSVFFKGAGQLLFHQSSRFIHQFI